MKKLFFALITSFLFVATSWGQCYSEYLQSTVLEISKRNAVAFETDFTNHPVKKVSFMAKRDATGIGNLYLEQCINGSWNSIWEVNPGVVTKTFWGIESEVDYANYEVTIDNRATAIRFKTDGVLSYKKYLTSVKLEHVPDHTVIPTDSKDFGVVSFNSDNNKTVKVEYSSLTSNLTVKLTQQDNVFSTSLTGTSTAEAIVAKNDCSFGSKDITIYFKPTEYGVYTNQLEFSNGTKVFLRGECSTNFDIKAANFTVEKVSYTSIKLKWNAVPGASGYRIVNQTNGATYTVDANTTSLNAMSLSMNTEYQFVLYALFNGATSLNATLVSATTLNKEGVVIEDCPKLYENYNAKEQTIGVVGYNKPMIYDNISLTGNLPSYKVRFRAKMTKGSVVGNPDLCMYVKLAGKSDYEDKIYWEGRAAGLDETHREYFVEVPQNTVAIKFDCDENGATLTRHVDDLYIFRENILDADKTELDFGEVALNEYKDLSVNLTYSNIAKLEAMLDSDFFSIQSFKETDACTDGTQEVVIRFEPTACLPGYEESLTIFNGLELGITLKGTLKKNDETVKHIIWNGSVSTDWDNRDNWQKTDGTRLTCADVLSEDLTVIIPGGLTQYPIIPDVSTQDKFFTERNDTWNGTQVNAGDNATAIKIAHKIVLEQGASIVGVETLYNPSTGVRRYHEVEKQFEANRKEWLLVGTVVKPWDESGNGEVRNILSQDYFLYHLPQVYMHEAIIDQNKDVTWDSTFIDLDKEVPHNKAFAIYIANEYGPNYWPASTYDYNHGTSFADDQEHPHKYTFTGHFYNESSVIEYNNLTPQEPVMLCNTYPASIDAYALDNDVDGTIQYYDYTSKSFKSATEGAVIMPQNGFVFTPNQDATSITIDAKYMKTTATENRSAVIAPTVCRIKANNAARSVSSEISIQYNEYKEDVADFSVDAPKLFAKETAALPDIYVIRYDANWASVSIPDLTQPIPLGVTINSSKQTFTLEMTQNNMPYTWVLEDRTTSTMYNLSNGEVCTVSGLKKGDYKGRFYLHATPIQEEDNKLTNIDEEFAQNNNIDIFVQEGTVIVSATQEAQLQSIVVSDMVGRSTTYTVNDQYAEISLPKSKGIYIINVVGEAGIATKKVRL